MVLFVVMASKGLLEERRIRMDPQITAIVASVCAGLSAICVVLSLWNFVRSSRLEAQVDDLDTKLPHKRVVEMEQAVDSLIAHINGLEQKNTEFKQSVHNSVQRLDQIMRRNEKAAASLLDENGDLQADAVPGQLPPELVSQAPRQPGGQSKQQALRLRYNQNRGIQ
jgi:hypothetical protein